MDDVIRCS